MNAGWWIVVACSLLLTLLGGRWVWQRGLPERVLRLLRVCKETT